MDTVLYLLCLSQGLPGRHKEEEFKPKKHGNWQTY